MIKEYSFKKSIPLIFAIIILIYLIFCISNLGFSTIIFTIFFIAITLNIGLFYVLTHKINPEQMPPKFYQYFIKTTYIIFFSIIIFVILVNLIFLNALDKEIDEDYDYVIVFGSSVTLDDNTNMIINKRLERCIEVANESEKTKFVLTGAKVNEDVMAEAYYMRNYLLEKGIEESRIMVDIFSYNTYENIQNSLYMIKEDVLRRNVYENIINEPFASEKESFDIDNLKIGFLSNDWHLMRIAMMAKKLGVENVHLIISKTNSLYYIYYLVREELSLFKALVLGQLKIFAVWS